MKETSKKVINWRIRTKQKIISSMGGNCQICSYDKCAAALELHHIDQSQKDFSFGSIRANPKSASLIKEELKKCILLCCRCHREIHNSDLDIPESYAKFDEEIFDVLFEERKQRKEIFKKEKIWRQKIFLTNQEVYVKLIEEYGGNKSKMAKEYGVSETSIRKRVNKHIESL
jgi:hypothetical protein